MSHGEAMLAELITAQHCSSAAVWFGVRLPVIAGSPWPPEQSRAQHTLWIRRKSFPCLESEDHSGRTAAAGLGRHCTYYILPIGHPPTQIGIRNLHHITP